MASSEAPPRGERRAISVRTTRWSAARLDAAGPVVVLGGVSDMRGSLYRGWARLHWEAFFGCLIAIASTLLCYFFEFQNDTSAVSTILGVVIVFPITR